MFTTKYHPNKLTKFIGNQQSIQPFIKWLFDWDVKNKKQKCLLISGMSGIGKSLLVELVLKKHFYHAIELSTDDEINKENITPILKTKKTFDGKKNVIIFSDIDSNTDYGFIKNLTEYIKESCIPIICICENRYDQSLKPILNNCFDIKLSKPKYDEIYAFIYNVIITEKIRITKTNVDKLIEEGNGDIRFILNTLQFYSTTNISIKIDKINANKNIQSANIFDTTTQLFSMENSLEDKYNVYWMNHDIHTLMVHENYINNTLKTPTDLKKMQNMSYSSDALCDSDIFNKSVNMTNWEFEPYIALHTIKATTKCNKKSQIKFTQFLGKASTHSKNKKKKISINDSLNCLSVKCI